MRTSQRPRLRPQPTTLDMVAEGSAALALVVLLALPVIFWNDLPARIPNHFGFSGEPNSTGPRSTIWLLPGVMLTLYGGLTVLNRFPYVFNYPTEITPDNAEQQYRLAQSLLRWLKAEMLLIAVYIEWMIIEVARGEADGLDAWFLPLSLLVIFGTLAVFVVRLARQR